MRPWKITLVKQRGKTCTIACLAMILGQDFDDVEKHFAWPEEMTLSKVSDFLGDQGYSVLLKELLFHAHHTFGRSEIMRPFAPAHIVHCKQYADDPIQHVVVMDQKGNVFDPACDPPRSLSDYYMLTGVLGIWRPEDL